MTDETRLTNQIHEAADTLDVAPVPTSALLTRGKKARRRIKATKVAAAAVLVAAGVVVWGLTGPGGGPDAAVDPASPGLASQAPNTTPTGSSTGSAEGTGPTETPDNAVSRQQKLDALNRLSQAIGNQDTTNTETRDITVDGITVSVPASWVSTPNGCEDFLGATTYLHTPQELGTATCGTLPSIVVVPTDQAPGTALTRYPHNEQTINGNQVLVGDSCLPTAACVYPNGLLAIVPATNTALLVSAGSEPNNSVAQQVISSIRFSN